MNSTTRSIRPLLWAAVAFVSGSLALSLVAGPSQLLAGTVSANQVPTVTVKIEGTNPGTWSNTPSLDAYDRSTEPDGGYELDARAGSPPTASQCMLRAANEAGQRRLESDLVEWERWAAGLLDSHLSFPVLSYYRSQHDNQSWLAAVTCMLDTCALRMAILPQTSGQQARLTFAMARHAVVDLSLVFRISPTPCVHERFTIESCRQLVDALREQELATEDADAAFVSFNELRAMYEPFVWSLAEYFLIELPDVVGPSKSDNWQTSPWMKPTPTLNELISSGVEPVDEHFR